MTYRTSESACRFLSTCDSGLAEDGSAYLWRAVHQSINVQVAEGASYLELQGRLMYGERAPIHVFRRARNCYDVDSPASELVSYWWKVGSQGSLVPAK